MPDFPLHQFPVVDHLIHLNHAAVGPWPKCTTQAVQAFAEQNLQVGSQHYLQWLEVEKNLRNNLATLIHASSPDEIALVKNTSEGLSFIAYGLDWNKGDNVVGIRQEFPSNRYVWDSLADQGVAFRKLDLDPVDDPEQGLFALCDENTRLVSISAVQYADGYRMNLQRVGEFCRANNILFCVDAIQHIGALPFDVQAIQADFAIADGHKWLLAPEGLGLFYVRHDVMDRLRIRQFGWHMVESIVDYTDQDFELNKTARRFECGSPNMLGIHALNASVELLLQTGLQAIGERVIDNSRFLMNQLSGIERVRLLSDSTEERLSGIVTFAVEGVDMQQLYQQLGQQNLLCAPRGGGIRLSPHFYTPREQLAQTVELIRNLSS